MGTILNQYVKKAVRTGKDAYKDLVLYHMHTYMKNQYAYGSSHMQTRQPYVYIQDSEFRLIRTLLVVAIASYIPGTSSS